MRNYYEDVVLDMKKELIQRIIIDYQNKKQQKLTERDLKIEFIPNMAIGII